MKILQSKYILEYIKEHILAITFHSIQYDTYCSAYQSLLHPVRCMCMCTALCASYDTCHCMTKFSLWNAFAVHDTDAIIYSRIVAHVICLCAHSLCENRENFIIEVLNIFECLSTMNQYTSQYCMSVCSSSYMRVCILIQHCDHFVVVTWC